MGSFLLSFDNKYHLILTYPAWRRGQIDTFCGLHLREDSGSKYPTVPNISGACPNCVKALDQVRHLMSGYVIH